MHRLQTHLILFLCLALVASCSPVAGPTPSETAVSATAPADTLPTPAETLSEEQTASLIPTMEIAPQPTFTATQPPLPPEVPVPGMELESLSAANLELAKQAGAHWTRRNGLDWSAVEPQEGERNWAAVSGLEAELKRASDVGLEFVLVVRGTPAWAQAVPGAWCGPVKAEKLDAFARFLHDAVARYSVAPYSVTYWELGNEVDIDPTLVESNSPFGCMGQAGDPLYGGEAYAGLLKAAYPQIKAANPEAQVLIGGLLMDCDPRKPPKGKDCASSFFLKGILRGGGGDFFDGVSFHAYDYYTGADQYGNANWGSAWDTTGPVVVAKTRYLRDLLTAQGYPDKYLMNTEAGLLCGKDGKEPACQSEDFQRTKAAYIAMVHTAAQIYGLRANIWFSLASWRGTGLITPENEPDPAMGAFRITAEQLNAAAYTRPVGDYPGVRAYEFLRDGRRVLLLVSLDGQEHAVKFRAAPAAVHPVYGAAVQPAETLTVGAVPIFVEFAP